MSQADKIAYQGSVSPNIVVEVDEWGQIQMAVNMRQGENVGLDGWARADVTNATSVTQALESARDFVAAVFPNGKQPPGDGRWRKRRDAYLALITAGKMPYQRTELARTLGDFLSDYDAAEAVASEGNRPHMTMEEYAKEWERWW